MTNSKITIPLKKYYGCYDYAEVCRIMRKQGRLKQWEKWYRGQTGMVKGGRFLVYPYDLISFIEGMGNYD